MIREIKAGYWILIFLTAAFAAVMAFYRLGDQPVNMWDESHIGVNAAEMLENGNFIVPYYKGEPETWHNKPPLLVWLTAASFHAFGMNEFALRLPSAAAAVATALLLLLGGRYFSGSWPAGAVAAFALISMPGYMGYHAARTGDYDALLTFFMLAATFGWFAWLRSGRKAALIFFGASFTLAIFTKGIAGCLFAPGWLIAWLLSGNFSRDLKNYRVWLSALIPVLLAIAYYLLRNAVSPGFFSLLMENELGGRYGESLEGHVGGIWYYFQEIREGNSFWIFWLPLSLMLIRKKESAFLWIWITGIIYFSIITFASTKTPWYDVPLYPLMALLAGFAAGKIIDLAAGKFSRAQALMVRSAALAALLIPPFIDQFNKIKHPPEHHWLEERYASSILKLTQIHPRIRSFDTWTRYIYNSQVEYAREKLEESSKALTITHKFRDFIPGDTIHSCEPDFIPLVDSLYSYSVIMDDYPCFAVAIHSPGPAWDSIPHKMNPFVKLFRQMEQIRHDRLWMEQIRRKTILNRNTLRRQILLDAIYVLKMENKLSAEEVELIEEKLLIP